MIELGFAAAAALGLGIAGMKRMQAQLRGDLLNRLFAAELQNRNAASPEEQLVLLLDGGDSLNPAYVEQVVERRGSQGLCILYTGPEWRWRALQKRLPLSLQGRADEKGRWSAVLGVTAYPACCVWNGSRRPAGRIRELSEWLEQN